MRRDAVEGLQPAGVIVCGHVVSKVRPEQLMILIVEALDPSSINDPRDCFADDGLSGEASYSRYGSTMGRKTKHYPELYPARKPQQNAYIELYNRRVRHEWLDPYIFESIHKVQGIFTNWLWT